MSGHRIVVLAAMALLGAPGGARAQARPDSSHHGLCWTARPAPRCHVLLLTNFGAYADMLSAGGSSAGRLVDDVGLMVNVNGREAVGASVLVDLKGVVSVGPALRYRRWTGGEAALDLAVGARGAIAGVDHGAVIGLIKYQFGPYFGVALRPELVRRETPANVWPVTQPVTGWGLGLSVGVEIGSWPGAAAAAVVGLASLAEFMRHGMNIQITGGGSPKW